MVHKVKFAPAARADLIELHDFIAELAGPLTALGYVERIEASCLSLAHFPERGTRHDELRPGLRTMGFERRVTIALDPGLVVIDRVLYGGRDLQRALNEP